MRGLLTIVMLFLSSAHAAGELSDAERITRMQAAIDELADRVSELKAENSQLEEALAEALEAGRTGRRVVTGCDVGELRRELAFESNRASEEFKFLRWAESNGSNCTSSQLRELMSIARSLAYSDEAIKAVQFLQSLN